MDNRIRISCSRNNLKDIRIFVTKTLKSFHVPELEISMLVLAVDEICANRIIHSNQNNNNSFLELEINKDTSGNISFEIIDEGDLFDHTTYPDADIKQLVKDKRKGGLGLMLVRKIMDSFEVKRVNDHTVCRLTKNIPSIH